MPDRKYRWEFYQDGQGKWRWRKLSTVNGQIVGSSSESFASRQNAVNNARIMGYQGS